MIVSRNGEWRRTGESTMPAHHAGVACCTYQRIVDFYAFSLCLLSNLSGENSPKYEAKAPIEKTQGNGDETHKPCCTCCVSTILGQKSNELVKRAGKRQGMAKNKDQ